MASFYKELKKIREGANITLAEIQNRTKIDIRFLEAFENGQFDLLPHTYIRLFFRAYVTEIGGDATQALSDLEHHINGDIAKSKKAKQAEVQDIGEDEGTLSESFKPKSPVLKRSNILKAAVLVIFWVFALFIIRRITLESDGTAMTQSGQHIITDHVVTDQELLTDYVVLNSMETTHNAQPPFSLRISGKRIVSYTVKVDTGASETVTMPGGDSRSFIFNSDFSLLLNHSQGVSVFLNGNPLKDFTAQNDPVRVEIVGTPPVIRYQYYTPFQ